MNKGISIFLVVILSATTFAITAKQSASKTPYYSRTDNAVLNVSDAQWAKVLPKGVYQVMREKGTETAYTGAYWDNHKEGTYYCAACGHPLFSSSTKFDSHTGWPSFYEPLNKNSVINETDNSFGMERTEVLCARCKGHLGHVFDDGPAPTHLRYCMNSAALDFEPAK